MITKEHAVYQAAGIADLNSCFSEDQYPPDSIKDNPFLLLDAFGNPKIVLSHAWDLGKIVGDKSFRTGGQLAKEQYQRGDVPTMQIPARQGLLADLEETPFFQRMRGISQLGFRRDQPALNFHSRATHTRWVVVQAVNTLAAMYDDSPEAVTEKLAIDLKEMGLLADNATETDIITISSKILTVATAHHDVATPAGGDTMKGFLKEHGLPHDEEELLEAMIFNSSSMKLDDPFFVEGRVGLWQSLAKFNLGEADMRAAIAMIKGDAPTLIGELVKSRDRDILEPDRMAYTFRDWLEFGLLAPDMPPFWKGRWFTEPISNPDTQNYFRSEIWRIGRDMEEPLTHHVFPELTLEWNKLDPSSSAKLSPEGYVVYTDVDKVLATCLLRIYGHKDIYLGAKMQGHEALLRRDLTTYVEKHGWLNPLQIASLLSSSDEQMIEGLVNEMIQNGEKRLAEQIWRATRLSDFSHFDLDFIDPGQEYPGYAITIVERKFKPGFDTLVIDPKTGQQMTIKDFCDQNDDHFLAWNIVEELKQCADQNLVVLDI